MKKNKIKEVLTDFKAFISKGNVVDLAVAVIMGSAFGKIVSSLVDNIIMPLVGILIGGVNFSDLTITINSVVIEYGIFVQNVIDFMIIALSIFIALSFIKKEEKQEKPKKTKSVDEKQLDMLKEISKKIDKN